MTWADYASILAVIIAVAAMLRGGRPLPAPPAASAPERERLSGECWVNVHSGGAVECYRHRSYADAVTDTSGGPRIACIRIDLSQHYKGEGLSP